MYNSFNTVTNKDKKFIGFWIRPDQELSGTHYDKLLLQT